MGNLLNRSSRQDSVKMRKDKRKRRHQQLDQSFEHDTFLNHNENKIKDPNAEFFKSYELWNKELNQQHMMNMNDPPGAPGTYPSNYSASETDLLTQSWSSAHNIKNPFYQLNSLPMTTSFNVPYIPDQYNHNPIINYQSKIVVPEERPLKKLHSTFSQQQQQQQAMPLKSLSSTHSWHESSNISMPITTKPERLSNRSSVTRPTAALPKTISIPISVEKPIYVGIDHKATLAERGQTVAHKRRHKSREKNHSDGLNSPINNHQTRSVTTHRTPTDSPTNNINTISNKSFDSIQSKSSGSQNFITKSQSAKKSIPLTNNNNNNRTEIKPLKPRNNHQQNSSIDNEIKSSKNQENHSQHRRHHHQQDHLPTFSKESSLINTQTSTRRTGTQQSNTPMMRIPLSQLNHQRQNQPIILSTATRVTRIRM